MELRGATASDVGNVRETNQDRAHFAGYLAAVADGMGGHRGGETAATIAISGFSEVAGPIGAGGLVELVEDANDAVFRKAAEPELHGMGTTLVALTLRPAEENVSIVNVGDSRAYFLRGGELDQLTKDHSLVEDLVRQNRLTPEEALTHPQRNILTRALGIASHVDVDSFLIPVELGDRFLLCSDGLFNEVTEDEIGRILLNNPEPNDAARSLVEAALSGAARDNVTVAVIDVVPDGQGENLSPESARTMVMPVAGPGSDDTMEAPPVNQTVNNGFTADAAAGYDAGAAAGVTADPQMVPANHPAQTTQQAPVQPMAHAQAQAVTTQPVPVQPVPGHPQASITAPGPAQADSADPNQPASGHPSQPGHAILENEFGHPTVAATAELPVTEPPRRRRGRGLLIFIVLLGLVYAGLHLYAQSNWFVDESDGEVAIFRGQTWGFLWLSPTVDGEQDDPIMFDLLPEEAQAEVRSQQSFGSRAAAQRFVDELAERIPDATELGAELSEIEGGEGTERGDPAADSTATTSTTTIVPGANAEPSPPIAGGDSGGPSGANTTAGDEASDQGTAGTGDG